MGDQQRRSGSADARTSVAAAEFSAVQNVDESVASATAVDAGATATMDAPQCCIHIAAAQSRRDISDASVQQTSCVDPVPDFVLTQRCRRLSDCLRICAIGLFRIL